MVLYNETTPRRRIGRAASTIEKEMTRLALCIGVLACLAGCGQDDVARVRHGEALDAAEKAAGTALDAEIVLCRRVGSKTGKRIDVGDEFAASPEKKNRYIHGFVDVSGASEGVHQVHLVWIRPDGKELFRKFAEVAVAAAPEGFSTEITWLQAEDLHYAQVDDPVVAEAADFSLYTKLNVAPEKEREPGEYALRVYWNRELLVEKTFLFHRQDG